MKKSFNAFLVFLSLLEVRSVFMLQMSTPLLQEPWRLSVENLGFRGILCWIEDKPVCFAEKHANFRVQHENCLIYFAPNCPNWGESKIWHSTVFIVYAGW